MNILDLIILVLIGVFIYSRFFGGDQLPTDHKLNKKKSSSGRSKPLTVVDFPKTPAPEADDGSVPGLAELKKKDPSFREKAFLKGAQEAYKFYYASWNKKDDDALANLVSPTYLDDLIGQLDKLDQKGHWPKVEVKEFERVDILEARLNGQTAIVDVQFRVLQSENTVKEDAKFVGKEKEPKVVASVWTLARSLKSEDPNWELEGISQPN